MKSIASRQNPLFKRLLRAIRDGRLRATPVVMIGNRRACRGVAEQFGIEWHQIDDGQGNPDHERMIELFDHVLEFMPADDPGTLDAQLTADLVAYLLQANGYPPGEKELPANDPARRSLRLEPPR